MTNDNDPIKLNQLFLFSSYKDVITFKCICRFNDTHPINPNTNFLKIISENVSKEFTKAVVSTLQPGQTPDC